MKGMIFTTESVRAILDGHKTQTRRVVKFGKIIEYENGILKVDTGRTTYMAKYDKQVGDILYVREKYRTFNGIRYCWQGGAYIPAYDFSGINYYADDEMRLADTGNLGEMFLPSEDVKEDITYGNWHSPLFMPKEAARLFLRVTDVRAEKLHDIVKHDIDVGDIRREGIIEPCLICETLPGHYNGNCRKIMAKNECGMINAYAELWDNANKKYGHGWNTNPWVWVYTFERTERGKE
jgi:hypothetical protein